MERQDSDPAFLNAFLRCFYASYNCYHLYPEPTGPLEVDHFFEVQHIVNLLLQRTTIGNRTFEPLLDRNCWYNCPVGQLIDLATSVSDHRNCFRIEKSLNQAKKRIELGAYEAGSSRDPRIQTYLRKTTKAPTTGGQGPTVESELRALVHVMRTRNSIYPDLTRGVGERLWALMGWDSPPATRPRKRGVDIATGRPGPTLNQRYRQS